MRSMVEQETRVHIVDGDLDNLYYADEPEEPPLPCKKVPTGDIYEAARAGDVERLKILLERGTNVNVRDAWDSVALYYACLAGHLDAARMLMECGAICSENTFDGDRCHYAALNLRVRKLLKAFEARPPPLEPLPRSLRELFLSAKSNLRYSEGLLNVSSDDTLLDHEALPSHSALGDSFSADFNPDITFFVHGQPIEAHRAILVARSPYFKAKFEKDWKEKNEVRFSNTKLTFPALFSLIQFFYTDRLDVAVEDMEDLARICKVCGCAGLQTAVERELSHQKFAEYKHMGDADDSQKRFILQGSSLQEEERLPFAMRSLLNLSLMKAKRDFLKNEDSYASKKNLKVSRDTDAKDVEALGSCLDAPVKNTLCREDFEGAAVDGVAQDDHADVCFIVEDALFRSHQVILAARSDYFRTRFSRMKGFRESKLEMVETDNGPIPVLQEKDLSSETFEKLLEYMYTDQVLRLEPSQAEELFDAASRYLLFPLKKVVADALLPHLETATPGELCHWLLAADMYGVWKLREYCLDTIAANFDIFSETREFRRMLCTLPPPSGDSSQRTSAPSAPGGEGKANQGNLLDDLREKWLEAEGAELDKRDESATQFDKILEMLVLAAESEGGENDSSFDSQVGKLAIRDLNLE
eukprot:c7564_g1_i1 orf=507-2432(+)